MKQQKFYIQGAAQLQIEYMLIGHLEYSVNAVFSVAQTGGDDDQ